VFRKGGPCIQKDETALAETRAGCLSDVDLPFDQSTTATANNATIPTTR
jgi:hypothetical protein